jgi:integrase
MRLEFRNKALVAIIADPTKEVTAWDTVVPGLALRVSKRGVKTFAFKYRHGGRQVMAKIGRLGELTIEEARRVAIEYRQRLTQGIDPQQAARDRRAAMTVADAAARWLEEHAPRVRPRTLASYVGVVQTAVVPALGRMPLRDLTAAQVSALHHDLRGQPCRANLALVCVTLICKAGETWGDRPLGSNPCQHIRKYPTRARHRYLSPEELTAVGIALTEAETRYGRSAVDCLRLILLTGARKTEITRLRWSQVDLDNRRLVFDPSEHKTGGGIHAKQIPLGEPAIALLAERRVAGDHSEWVFPSAADDRPLPDVTHPWQWARVLASKNGIDVTDVSIHDLRHTWGAMATSGGHALQTIGAVMGHRNASTTARYAHVAPSPAAVAVEDTSARIAAALGGGKGGRGKVKR